MLTETDYIGYKKFVWFIGVVEDVNDPVKVSRVKVRMLSLHTEDKALLPTENLPWAHVMMPATSASISGIGFSPSGLVQGSWVVGFFLDGEEANQPLVIGTWHGIPEETADPAMGFNDPSGIYPSYIDRPDTHKNTVGADTGLFANNANNLQTSNDEEIRFETSIQQDTPSEGNAAKEQLAKLSNAVLNLEGNKTEITVFDKIRESALSGGSFGLGSVTGALSSIGGIGASLQGGLAGGLENIAGGEALGALNDVRDAATGAIESVSGSIDELTGGFIDTVNSATGAISNPLSGALEAASGISDGLNDTVSGFTNDVLGQKISDKLDLEERLSQSVKGVIADKQKNILDEVTGKTIGKIQSEVDLRTGRITSVTDALGNPLTTLNGILGADGNPINNLENIVLGSSPKDGASVLHTLDPVIDEPPSPVNTVYPHNKVYSTTSGHLIEVDDTPDSERIRIYHKAGTFIEVHPNGDIVNYHGNRWSVTDGNDKLRVKGNVEVYVDGNAKVESIGKVEVTGSEVAIGAAGTMKLTAAALDIEAGSIKMDSKSGITAKSVTNTIRAGKYNFRGGQYEVKAFNIKLN